MSEPPPRVKRAGNMVNERGVEEVVIRGGRIEFVSGCMIEAEEDGCVGGCPATVTPVRRGSAICGVGSSLGLTRVVAEWG